MKLKKFLKVFGCKHHEYHLFDKENDLILITRNKSELAYLENFKVLTAYPTSFGIIISIDYDYRNW